MSFFQPTVKIVGWKEDKLILVSFRYSRSIHNFLIDDLKKSTIIIFYHVDTDIYL
jgi:hypothetical protein